MTANRVLDLMSECFNGLKEGGLIEGVADLDGETVLLGEKSNLDSIGFVSFVSDLEERLSKELGREYFIVLSDIQDFNVSSPSLSASALNYYIMRTAGNIE